MQRYTALEIQELRRACQTLARDPHLAEAMVVTYMANGTKAEELKEQVDEVIERYRQTVLGGAVYATSASGTVNTFTYDEYAARKALEIQDLRRATEPMTPVERGLAVRGLLWRWLHR